MKLNKVFLASMLAVSAATSAFASTGTYDVVLRITGSTAFRGSAATAIANIITTNKRIGYYTTGSDGVTSHTGATYAVYTGTLASGKTILVQTAWTGSEDGFVAVASTSPSPLATWIADNAINTAAVDSSTAISPGYTADSALANVTMADNAQSESAQKGTGFTNLTSVRVGVIPFVWIRSNTLATTQSSINQLTNITSQQAQSIFGNTLTLAAWTHNSADSAITVYPVGRNSFSGTRLNCLYEAFAASKTAISFPVSQVTTANDGTNLNDYTFNTLVSDGYSGGGALVQAIAKPAASNTKMNAAVFVGYAGTGDVKAANYPGISQDGVTGIYSWTAPVAITGASSPVLSYNGVPYSLDAVKDGTYSFWGYEYIAYGTAITGNTNNNAAIVTLRNRIIQNDASVSGIKLGDMRSGRGGAGQPPISQ